MKKAFITTRIGDVGFFLGILMLYWKTGTLNLYTHDALIRRAGAGERAGAADRLVGLVGGGHDCVAAVHRRDGQERAVPAACVVAGRDGRPDTRQRADSRGDDGRGGRVHGRAHVPAVYGGCARRRYDAGAGFRHVDRLLHGGVLGDDCGGAVRHQTRAGVFDLFAAWVHGDGAWRGQLGGRDNFIC